VSYNFVGDITGLSLFI